MSDSPIPEALVCPRCGGRLEAAAQVYFDLTGAERGAEGELVLTGIELAELNDSFDGHPVALELELVVSCAECGKALDARLGGAALARAAFRGAKPADAELLLAAARDIYHGAREGQAAVEAWARGPRVAPHVSYRRCESCEASTPHVASVCALCESAIGAVASQPTPTSAVLAALRVEAKAREAMAEMHEEQQDEEAAGETRARARYLDRLAEELAQPPLISLVYGEADVRDCAAQAEVGQALALRRAREWGRQIQETAARLCTEQLLSVVRSGQP